VLKIRLVGPRDHRSVANAKENPMSDSSSEHSGLHDLRALAARVATTRAIASTTADRVSFPVLLAPVGSELTHGTHTTPLHAPSAPRSRRPLGIAARVALASSVLALSALAFAMAPRSATPLPALAGGAKQKAPVLVVAEHGTHELDTPEPLPEVAPPSSPTTNAPDVRPTERRTRVPSTPRRVAPVVATTETPSAPSPRERSELDRLLDEALGGRSSTTTESLPMRPDARALTTTLRGLEARIARCALDDGGTATARLVIDGATGRVRDVSWVGATPASHTCIEAVLDDVEVPRFEQSSFAIAFPYRLGL
jgi:hypothetical protein